MNFATKRGEEHEGKGKILTVRGGGQEILDENSVRPCSRRRIGDA